MKKIIILGADGEIGSYLSKKLSNNFAILGTSKRKQSSNTFVDFSEKKSIEKFINRIDSDIYGIINCYGIQKPIQDFIKSDFNDWEKNITINFQNYAFFLHKVLNKNFESLKKIISFSGGGATGPRKLFSAYAISKISIYKLSEILSEELKDVDIDINVVAPGIIKSKMTEEVFKEGKNLGIEYDLASEALNNGGDSKDKVFELCNFLLSKDSDNISGKLIAAQWDNFEHYKSILKSDKNLFSLRRIDEKFFTEIKDTK